jgi:hypothetical protein
MILSIPNYNSKGNKTAFAVFFMNEKTVNASFLSTKQLQ